MRPPSGQEPSAGPPPTFPKARQGYQRSSVDQFVAQLQAGQAALQRQYSAQEAEGRRLTAALTELQATYERLRTAEIDERAQDILSVAEEQAAALVAKAVREAELVLADARREAQVVEERARQELAWGRRRLRDERARLAHEPTGQSSREPAEQHV
jgi:cell division septum initiation protein DivIVA